MSIIEIMLVAVGLSMDAFAVSICKGLALREMKWRYALVCGLYFGIFQALMPALGYLLGSRLMAIIADFDHWIAFVLLFLIGLKMIKEAGDDDKEDSNFDVKTMLLLAVATSIDALAVGISFAVLKVNVLLAVLIIGATTFAFGFAGVKIGNLCGTRLKLGAERVGGVILILIGTKILLEHLGILSL